MKKVLFAAYSLDVGGIEKSLITLLNYLTDTNEYDITLLLEKKEGTFLSDLDNRINIIEYKPSESKNIIVRKLINLCKRLAFIIKNYNNYEFAVSYATYSKVGSFCARCASTKNNALWVHTNYIDFFENDEDETRKFFKGINIEKFKKVVFVSDNSKSAFEKMNIIEANRLVVCNNLVDTDKIRQMANEDIGEIKEKVPTFVHVGRHSEKEKKITRVILAATELKDEKFKILLVGSGCDNRQYRELVKQYNLEKIVLFVGEKKNPYPYIKKSDYVILTSDYEGLPTIYLEALTLGKPVLTTNVSDAERIISNKYGVLMGKDVHEISEVMRRAINNKYQFNEVFDMNEYNGMIKRTIKKII